MSDRKADDHRRKARWYLKEAGETTDLAKKRTPTDLRNWMTTSPKK
jgi:hypothetical protein